MKNKKLFIIVLISMLLVGCVPGNERFNSENPAGFFWGVWHGMIVWISFFMGLFTGGAYTIYESNNTGWAYNLGFILGMSACVGGASKGLVNITINKK
jgi:hypothetical protein